MLRNRGNLGIFPAAKDDVSSIKIKMNMGASLQIKGVTSQTTIGELKQKIRAQEAISANQYELKHAGVVLQDNQKIADLGLIQKKAAIQMNCLPVRHAQDLPHVYSVRAVY